MLLILAMGAASLKGSAYSALPAFDFSTYTITTQAPGRSPQDVELAVTAPLEEELLENLSNADPETILDNKELIESLEVTKATSIEIAEKQKVAAITEVKINESRNVYRIVAAEGAMLYFLLIQLCVVQHMYQYSLGAFTTFFFKAFEKTEQFEEEDKRVIAL